jgi:thioredoxin-like negative regulator of GroEL
MVENIVTSNFRDKISTGVSVIKFSSQYCGPCRGYAPIFHTFADNNKDVKCYAVDAIEESSISQLFGIQRVPLTIIFKDGKEMSRFEGVQTAAQLENQVQKVVS